MGKELCLRCVFYDQGLFDDYYGYDRQSSRRYRRSVRRSFCSRTWTTVRKPKDACIFFIDMHQTTIEGGKVSMAKKGVITEEELDKLYDELEEPRERGEKDLGAIVEINAGVITDFIPEEQVRGSPSDKAIQFKVATPDGYTINITGKLSMHPMAKFGRLCKILGHKPKIGDKVPITFDGQFWRADL